MGHVDIRSSLLSMPGLAHFLTLHIFCRWGELASRWTTFAGISGAHTCFDCCWMLRGESE